MQVSVISGHFYWVYVQPSYHFIVLIFEYRIRRIKAEAG